MQIKDKQPGDALDYPVNFERWITDDDAIENTPVVTVEPSGELEAYAVEVDSPIVKVWLRGGVAKASYKVTVKASTTGGRIKEQEFRIRVREL